MTHSERRRRWYGRWSERSIGAKVFVVVAFIVAVTGLLALFSAVTMWLWNALMPAIFKLPRISFWQAVGLLILAQIFFKGGHANRAGRNQWRKAKLRDRMRGEETEPGPHSRTTAPLEDM
jgi:hypothetical protein